MSGYTDMENTQPRCGILLVPSNLSCLPSALLILILNGFGIFFLEFLFLFLNLI